MNFNQLISLKGELSRRHYLIWGIILFAVKYNLDRWSVFVGIPFFLGFGSVLTYGYHKKLSYKEALGVALVSILFFNIIVFIIDDWALSWTTKDGASPLNVKNNIHLDPLELEAIHKWADQEFEDKKIGRITTFADFDTLMEYKTKFFGDIIDYKILSIYFPESERNTLWKYLKV